MKDVNLSQDVKNNRNSVTFGENDSNYNYRASTNNDNNENLKLNEINNDIDNNLDKNDEKNNLNQNGINEDLNNLNNNEKIKEENNNSIISNESGDKLEKNANQIITKNKYSKGNLKNGDSKEKENININNIKESNNSTVIKNKNKKRSPFFSNYENDSHQKNIYNMIYSKFEKDKEECLDGFEEFNTEIFEKEKEKGVNKKYNTIQIKKTIPILLSDEAFNRKMKEYQTESFSRKKQMELSEYSEKKMSKNESKN